MTGFSDSFPDEDLMVALGDDVIYIPSVGGSIAIKAVVDEGVERVGGDGYTIDPRTEIEFLKSAISKQSKRGDIIEFNSKRFELDAVLFDDAAYIRWEVK